MKKKKVVVVIMDGWGISPPDKFNAIDNAKTPNFDKLIRNYPNTSLRSDGESVGLPEGQFGTSEINHLTIGSGRVVWQDLPKINNSISDHSFFTKKALLDTIEHVNQNQSALHLFGIVSDGGVHSHIDHLFAILDLLEQQKFKHKVYLHVFADGRDVAPKSIEKYMKRLETKIAEVSVLKLSIASMQGRVYLDRDRDWERTEKAFQLIANAEGKNYKDWEAVVNFEYNANNKDEYFEQYSFDRDAKLKPNDAILCFHYRTDRQYQIIKRILNEKITNLLITSFVKASDEFHEVNIVFPREKISDTLAETLSSEKLKQLHVTETEKFPHLTHFLNGEREKEFPGESWKMYESNRFVKPKYQFEPSMRNFQITQRIIDAIQHDEFDFVIANLSSPDMVGHTGDYEAAVVSAQSVDYCLGEIIKVIEDKLDKYTLIVTADHGNSDIMWDYDNDQPHTQHTLAKVPFVLVSDYSGKLKRSESLSDIAPTILDIMGLKKPSVMTGDSLLKS